MEFSDQEVVADAIRRLRRIEGQVAGVIRMLEAERDCREVIQQIAAAGKALERVGVKLLSSQLQACLLDMAEGKGGDVTPDEIEKLFMSLA